jgi:uncharacterized protein (DUF58 family)
MLPRDVLRQIRLLQLRARRAVEDFLGGEYHSVFKGTGIAFEEVREYQPGDDVRSIDWNVMARMGHPFIKRFIEERELTVMLLVDASASQQFGTSAHEKRDVAAELAAILAFSAIGNNDKVGLIAFTDVVERFVPPRKGLRHALRLIRDVLYFQPARAGTSIQHALDYLNRVIRRRCIAFLLSDFLDRDFEKSLKHAGRRHDLIAVRITDPKEMELPPIGLLQLEDAENKRQVLTDAGSHKAREVFAAAAKRRRDDLRRLARSAKTDLIEVSTDGGHLDSLIHFFQMRERRLKRT